MTPLPQPRGKLDLDIHPPPPPVKLFCINSAYRSTNNWNFLKSYNFYAMQILAKTILLYTPLKGFKGDRYGKFNLWTSKINGDTRFV